MDTGRTRGEEGLVAACVALVVATPVAAWWLMDLITTAEHIQDPDYVVRPLPLEPLTKLLLGLAAAAVVGVAVTVLVFVEAGAGFVRRWWSVLLPLLAAGATCGGGLAVLTAPTIGANIGAGMFILSAPLPLLALVGWSAWRWWWLLKRPPRPQDGRS